MSIRENSVCTIYHKMFDSETRTHVFQRLISLPCFWDDVKNKTKAAAGFDNADQAFISISSVNGFYEPIAYSNLSDKTDKWTIQTGDKIVKGDIPDTEVKDLEQKYDSVLNVTSVDPKLFGSPIMHHVEIGAK